MRMMRALILVLASALICGARARQEPATPKFGKAAALRPQFKLKNGKEWSAGTAFVAREKAEGPALLFTALHLFGPAGGLDEQIPSDKLAERAGPILLSTFQESKVAARAEGSVIRTGFPITDTLDASGDVAAFTTTECTADVLTLAAGDAKAGDAVWALGDEFTHEPQELRAWSATVLRALAQRIEVRFAAKVDLRGFSGAPIINAKGEVIGMLSGMKDGKAFLVPVSSIRKHLAPKKK